MVKTVDKQKLNFVIANDGIFFMPIDVYLKAFSNTAIAEIKDE